MSWVSAFFLGLGIVMLNVGGLVMFIAKYQAETVVGLVLLTIGLAALFFAHALYESMAVMTYKPWMFVQGKSLIIFGYFLKPTILRCELDRGGQISWKGNVLTVAQRGKRQSFDTSLIPDDQRAKLKTAIDQIQAALKKAPKKQPEAQAPV